MFERLHRAHGHAASAQIRHAGLLLRFSVRMGVVMGVLLGTYATVIGFLVLFTGYIMAVVRGGSGGLGRRPHVWRGEVIDLRSGGRGLAYWWWRLRANLRNDKR